MHLVFEPRDKTPNQVVVGQGINELGESLELLLVSAHSRGMFETSESFGQVVVLRRAKTMKYGRGELALIDRTLEFGEPSVPLEGNSFEMKGSELDLLSRSNTLEFKVLFGSVNPSRGISARELRKVEFEFGRWVGCGGVLRVVRD